MDVILAFGVRKCYCTGTYSHLELGRGKIQVWGTGISQDKKKNIAKALELEELACNSTSEKDWDQGRFQESSLDQDMNVQRQTRWEINITI